MGQVVPKNNIRKRDAVLILIKKNNNNCNLHIYIEHTIFSLKTKLAFVVVVDTWQNLMTLREKLGYYPHCYYCIASLQKCEKV